METSPSRFGFPSSQATASAKALWISSPTTRVLSPSFSVCSIGSWRASGCACAAHPEVLAGVQQIKMVAGRGNRVKWLQQANVGLGQILPAI
jgi:hypothetical protein